MTTNIAGDLLERTLYKPFGEAVEGAAPAFGFTGQRNEPALGLYDYNARFYDPALGRFLSPDPIIVDVYDPQTLSSHSYVRNNPVTLVDPSGEQFLQIPVPPPFFQSGGGQRGHGPVELEASDRSGLFPHDQSVNPPRYRLVFGPALENPIDTVRAHQRDAAALGIAGAMVVSPEPVSKGVLLGFAILGTLVIFSDDIVGIGEQLHASFGDLVGEGKNREEGKSKDKIAEVDPETGELIYKDPLEGTKNETLDRGSLPSQVPMGPPGGPIDPDDPPPGKGLRHRLKRAFGEILKAIDHYFGS